MRFGTVLSSSLFAWSRSSAGYATRTVSRSGECRRPISSRNLPWNRRLTTLRTSVQATRLSFESPPMDKTGDAIPTTVLVGRKEIVRRMAKNLEALDDGLIDAMLEESSDQGRSTFVAGGRKVTLCVLPEETTRNNHPLSLNKLTSMVRRAAATKGDTIVRVGGVKHSAPVAAAVARAFPLYDRKTSNLLNEKGGDDGSSVGADDDVDAASTVFVSCLDADLNECLSDGDAAAEIAVAEGVRLACRLVDTTPEELTTEAFAMECRNIAEKFPDCVTMTEIVGEELAEKGYGGLYGVGKAATYPPRLVILEYEPPSKLTSSPGSSGDGVLGEKSDSETVALVGKGIVYDTGGLSLKSKTGMPGMKHDMGGAAGLLGGFAAAAALRVRKRIKLVLCLAENAIGPTAFRNDDILTLYSGKTVEINNSDAEGRLVLGDGVAHATRHFQDCHLVLDMATLTGAQLVTTGTAHAGILANSAALEERIIAAGKLSGDLVFPMLYAPELLRSEFDSEVADMKNSVKNRDNAQASCAGHFIEAHLLDEYNGGWVHVDMAGPASKDERGTGYGVALVLAMLEAPGFCQ